jgi:putative peptide zinc metalloprotease protein
VILVGPEQPELLLRPEDASGAVPRLARGVELLGPYRDCGLENPPYLVRRAGTVLQVSRLLYAIAEAVDGHRPIDAIATEAGATLERPLSADDVRHIVEARLAPAGIVAPDGERYDGPVAPPGGDDRVLALRYRWPLLGPHDVDAVARVLAGLFHPAVMAAILASVVGFDGWLFAGHGVAGAVEDTIRHPELILLIAAVTCLAGAFHEFGHAAACRYSGARPGVLGAGIYLVWPVLFTDVTDAYRLGRTGRLRTDLGGIYFNAVFVAGLAGLYAATGWEPLVAAVVVQHVAILDQLMPWFRFDGYYVISDLTGVPDILTRVRPALSRIIPGGPPDRGGAALQPRSRRILVAYFGSLAAFVAGAALVTIRRAPDLAASEWQSIGVQLHALGHAVAMWDLPGGVVVMIQLAVVAAPVVGLVLTVGLLAALLERKSSVLARPAAAATRSGARRSV